MNALKRVRKECDKHLFCQPCPMYRNVNGCILQQPPALWNVKEIKNKLKECKKEK